MLTSGSLSEKCPQAIVEVDTEFYKGSLPVVCMDLCIYDLIIGNDVYKNGIERYDVELEEEKMTDLIFENSNRGKSSVQLGSESKVSDMQIM